MSMPVSELARRWFDEVWNQKRDDAMEELLSPACAGMMEGPGEIPNALAFKAVRSRILEAFPDLFLTVEDMVAQGNKVVVRWAATATHRGHGLGAPTGCRIEYRGMTWLEFQDGKLIRAWDSWDHGGMSQKLQALQQQAPGQPPS